MDKFGISKQIPERLGTHIIERNILELLSVNAHRGEIIAKKRKEPKFG